MIRRPEKITGQVIHVDHFGNLITNLHDRHLPKEPIEITVGTVKTTGLAHNYSDADSLTALIGSHGYLELALSNGNACNALDLHCGAIVTVAF